MNVPPLSPNGALRLLRLVGACVALALAAFAVPPAGAAPGVPEYNAKAGYLLLFTRYVEWPARCFAAPTSPIVIGILGDNPFDGVLEKTVAGQTQNGRPIAVRVLASLEEAASCHVVFIGRANSRAQAAWLAALQGRPVLTVAETDDGLRQGAVISFASESTLGGARLKFDASIPAMERAGLRISSSMLQAARQAYRADPDPRRT